MISSISLGADSLGLGQMFGGTANALTSATGTAECGSKPTCIAITKTCKEKNRFYNECRMKALDVQNNVNLKSTTVPVENDPAISQKTMIIIGVVVLIVIVLILKKR